MSAVTGLERIAWARRSIPLSKASLGELNQGKPCHIGIVLPIDPAHASLALWLIETGFEVSILSETTAGQCADLLGAVEQAGAVVCGDRDSFAARGFDILLDYDGEFLARASEQLKGGTIISEQVTEHSLAPSMPVIHLGSSELIKTCGFEHGIAQSCVSGFLDITNLQIAGRGVVVLGYRAIGQGVAKMARAYGARVTVVEDNPVNAVRAKLDGHDVAALEEALPIAEVVFATSPQLSPLTLADLERLPDGAFLNTVLPQYQLVALDDLWDGVKIRDHVARYTLPSGKSVKLICEGRPVYIETGCGIPLEYSDLIVAAHLHAISLLCEDDRPKQNGLHALPADIETGLAKMLLGQ